MQQPQQMQFNNNFNNNNYGQMQQAQQQFRPQQASYFANTNQPQKYSSSNTRYNFALSEPLTTSVSTSSSRTPFNKKLVLLLFNRGELEKNRLFRADQLASELVNGRRIYKSKA